MELNGTFLAHGIKHLMSSITCTLKVTDSTVPFDALMEEKSIHIFRNEHGKLDKLDKSC